MNEKLIRLLLVAVGIMALGAFGWKLYGFFQDQDTLLKRLDVERLEGTFGSLDQARTGSHLQTYDNYAVLQDLNITGYVEPPPEVTTPVDTGPKPRISERDIEVPMIQYPNAAWIQARGARASEDKIPGDFRVVGDTFEIEGKEGLKLKLMEVRLGEVVIKVEDTGDELTIRGEEYEVDAGEYLVGGAEVPTEGGDVPVVPQSAPVTTRLTETGDYAVGTGDIAAIEKMSQEEILAAVPVRPARDPLSNEVRGLRIKSIQPGSVFERLGLRGDDIVLEVNGMPAVDRDQLFRELQGLQADTLTVKVERLGGVRTLSYRLPRR